MSDGLSHGRYEEDKTSVSGFATQCTVGGCVLNEGHDDPHMSSTGQKLYTVATQTPEQAPSTLEELMVQAGSMGRAVKNLVRWAYEAGVQQEAARQDQFAKCWTCGLERRLVCDRGCGQDTKKIPGCDGAVHRCRCGAMSIDMTRYGVRHD